LHIISAENVLHRIKRTIDI